MDSLALDGQSHDCIGRGCSQHTLMYNWKPKEQNFAILIALSLILVIYLVMHNLFMRFLGIK